MNRESYSPSPGINVTGMREDFLQLAIDQDTSICLCLVSSKNEDDIQMIDSRRHPQNGENGLTRPDSSASANTNEDNNPLKMNKFGVPNPVSLEIYLLHVFHKNFQVKVKERHFATRAPVPGQAPADSCGLSHFCKTVAHRIFSNKVLAEIECLVRTVPLSLSSMMNQIMEKVCSDSTFFYIQVSRIPYLQLLSHPTWHSRSSSWSLSLKFPDSIFHAGCLSKHPNIYDVKHLTRSQFHTKIVVKDDQVTVSGEGAPGILSSFRGISADVFSVSCYGCDLDDLPLVLLQQV